MGGGGCVMAVGNGCPRLPVCLPTYLLDRETILLKLTLFVAVHILVLVFLFFCLFFCLQYTGCSRVSDMDIRVAPKRSYQFISSMNLNTHDKLSRCFSTDILNEIHWSVSIARETSCSDTGLFSVPNGQKHHIHIL